MSIGLTYHFQVVKYFNLNISFLVDEQDAGCSIHCWM